MDIISGLKKRFEALNNITGLLVIIAPQYNHPKVYFEELIEKESDLEIAEKRVVLFEYLSKLDEINRGNKQLEVLREERDKALKDTDWTQLPDSPLTTEEKRYYRKYRFYLRDLPSKAESKGFGYNVKSFDEWVMWIKDVKHVPGFDKYIP